MIQTLTASAMENLTTVFTWFTSQASALLTTITGNPILLLGVGIFAAGAVIGLVYRLIRG